MRNLNTQTLVWSVRLCVLVTFCAASLQQKISKVSAQPVFLYCACAAVYEVVNGQITLYDNLLLKSFFGSSREAVAQWTEGRVGGWVTQSSEIKSVWQLTSFVTMRKRINTSSYAKWDLPDKNTGAF